MVKNCCVLGCKSESYLGCGKSFHRFPKDDFLKKKWVDIIPMKHDLKSYSCVCNIHFKSEDFKHSMARNVLKSDAIPSIFPVTRFRWQAWLIKCPFLCKYSRKSLDNVRICELHFLDQYVKNHRLTPDAIPILNLQKKRKVKVRKQIPSASSQMDSAVFDCNKQSDLHKSNQVSHSMSSQMNSVNCNSKTLDTYTFRVLIGVTGSVATIKLPVLIKSLLESSNQKIIFEITTICTEHSKHFFQKDELPSSISLYDDATEWHSWKNRGDPVIHIDLGKWADLMVIAPLDANTLAKISQGICDNLLTCTVRAWDMSKPLLFCPAMNTRMWNHPITPKQIAILKEWGYEEIPPISKTLMCGDTGVGAMAEVDSIVKRIIEIAENKYKE